LSGAFRKSGWFSGERASMFRLLKADSLQDMEAGYCQARLEKVAGFLENVHLCSAFLKLTASRTLSGAFRKSGWFQVVSGGVKDHNFLTSRVK